MDSGVPVMGGPEGKDILHDPVLKISAPVPVDGTQSTFVDEEIASLFNSSLVRCRYCGAEIHQGSMQFVGYNGGLLRTPLYPDTPHVSISENYDPTLSYPHIYCGCSDACLARDLSAGLAHLQAKGVID